MKGIGRYMTRALEKNVIEILKYFSNLRDTTGMLTFYHRDDCRMFNYISNLMDAALDDLKTKKECFMFKITAEEARNRVNKSVFAQIDAAAAMGAEQIIIYLSNKKATEMKQTLEELGYQVNISENGTCLGVSWALE